MGEPIFEVSISTLAVVFIALVALGAAFFLGFITGHERAWREQRLLGEARAGRVERGEEER